MPEYKLLNLTKDQFVALRTFMLDYRLAPNKIEVSINIITKHETTLDEITELILRES